MNARKAFVQHQEDVLTPEEVLNVFAHMVSN